MNISYITVLILSFLSVSHIHTNTLFYLQDPSYSPFPHFITPTPTSIGSKPFNYTLFHNLPIYFSLVKLYSNRLSIFLLTQFSLLPSIFQYMFYLSIFLSRAFYL